MNQRKRGIFALAATIGMTVATLAVTTTTASAVPHFIESSHVQSCRSVDITLHNVSPWIYPMSVETDGVHTYGPTVDNRTDMNGDGDVTDPIDLSGPQKDQIRTRTITFPEDSGTHTVRYRVQAGTEDDLYKNLPVGTWTELTIETDCANAAPTVSIASPVNGATYYVGQAVTADYSCADTDSTVLTCAGPVADGAAIDTATVGAKTFTVNATDSDGGSGSATASYTVAPLGGPCSGTALALPLNLNIATANPAGSPCVTRQGAVLNYTVPLIALPFPLTALSPTLSLKVLTASSESDGTSHRARATVSEVKISVPLSGWSTEIRNLWSETEASLTDCNSGTALSGTAEFGRIVRNGTIVYNQSNNPVSLAIPLVGGLHLNRVVQNGTTVSADALFIDLPGALLDIRIGHSESGIDC